MVVDTRLYDILAISPSANTAEIRKAYRKNALKWHPDKNPEPLAEEMFKDVYRAYEILSDASKRRNYDTFGISHFGPGGGRYGGTAQASSSSHQEYDEPDDPLRSSPGGPTDEDFGAFFREARSRRRARTRGRRTRTSAADEFPNIPSVDDLRPRPGFWLIIIYILMDLGVNAAAGAAAAAAGAHANGGVPTAKATRTGALAGLTKSGITGLVWFSSQWDIHWIVALPLLILGNGFGVALLVTVQVAHSLLGYVPKALVLAGLVAALPLGFEAQNHFGSFSSRGLSLMYFCVPCLCCCAAFPPAGPLLLIALDALGGFTFAALTRRFGVALCAPHVGAVAGAVYGTVSSFPSAFASLMECCFMCSILGLLEED